MKDASKEILGRIPDQMKLDMIKENNSIFTGFGVTIGVANTGIDLPAGQHAHTNYEFMFPLSRSIISAIENKKQYVEKNNFIPINTDQFHGLESELTGFRLICIDVDKSYLCEISHSLFGKSEICFENGNIEPQGDIMISIHEFMNEIKKRQTGFEFIVKGLQYKIAVSLIRNVRNNMGSGELNTCLAGRKGILRAIDYLYENYDNEFSLETVSQIADLSKYYFIRVFKEYTGRTPYEYFIDIKIDKAKEMLKQQKESITDICFLCGFNDPSHFTDLFRRKVGVTPSEFKRLIHT